MYLSGSIVALRSTILGTSLCCLFFSQPTHLGRISSKNIKIDLSEWITALVDKVNFFFQICIRQHNVPSAISAKFICKSSVFDTIWAWGANNYSFFKNWSKCTKILTWYISSHCSEQKFLISQSPSLFEFHATFSQFWAQPSKRKWLV